MPEEEALEAVGEGLEMLMQGRLDPTEAVGTP